MQTGAITTAAEMPASELDTTTEPQPQAYTPPEGWRLVQEGEELRQGDVRVNDSGACSAVLVTVTGVVPPGTRYIRPIEPQPQPEPPMLQDADDRIRLLRDCNARQAELIQELQYEKAGALQSRDVLARNNRRLTDTAEELRSEVSHVQRLLGSEKLRVAELEALVASLRTINAAQEKAVHAAGQGTHLQ